jgi:hypothetical protein
MRILQILLKLRIEISPVEESTTQKVLIVCVIQNMMKLVFVPIHVIQLQLRHSKWADVLYNERCPSVYSSSGTFRMSKYCSQGLVIYLECDKREIIREMLCVNLLKAHV